jgi:hypothetical protein
MAKSNLTQANLTQFFTLGKETGGRTLRQFEELGQKLFGQNCFDAEMDLAFRHFKTADRFADYWLKDKPNGLLLTPLQKRNHSYQ